MNTSEIETARHRRKIGAIFAAMFILFAALNFVFIFVKTAYCIIPTMIFLAVGIVYAINSWHYHRWLEG